MRLVILGGGGFRVPLVYRALLDPDNDVPITDVVLHDVSADRLEAIAAVLAGLAADVPPDRAPTVHLRTDLDEALAGASFVFSAIRVGGLTGRVVDERTALDEGLLGQETTGPGGICYGLRSVPAALHIAERVRAIAPDAWVINFTNPAGMVTEAMSQLLGDRVIGICDSPVGLCRRVAAALDVDPASARFDYAGLNHLGWLRAVVVAGRDRLPDLFADEAALTSFEEGALFGAEWLRAIAAVPNEYLHYYYFTREAVAALRGETRGEFLRRRQQDFYAAVRADPGCAALVWEKARAERDATYMAEARGDDDERSSCDTEGGGYEKVALALMRAIARGEQTTLILNVRDRANMLGLDSHTVIEVPCLVDASGARPFATTPLAAAPQGLARSVRAAERAAIEAATTRSRRSALRALGTHPLVDSVAVAGRLLDRYLDQQPDLAYLR